LLLAHLSETAKHWDSTLSHCTSTVQHVLGPRQNSSKTRESWESIFTATAQCALGSSSLPLGPSPRSIGVQRCPLSFEAFSSCLCIIIVVQHIGEWGIVVYRGPWCVGCLRKSRKRQHLWRTWFIPLARDPENIHVTLGNHVTFQPLEWHVIVGTCTWSYPKENTWLVTWLGLDSGRPRPF
jgi:hypothetical protein